MKLIYFFLFWKFLCNFPTSFLSEFLWSNLLVYNIKISRISVSFNSTNKNLKFFVRINVSVLSNKKGSSFLFIGLIFTKKFVFSWLLKSRRLITNRLLWIRTSRYGEIGRHAALRKQCESISVRVRVAADLLRKEIQ